MKDDPFTTLGVEEDADDETVKRRYLALVRSHPPDREPERFRAYRAAYEALADERKRIEARLLRTNGLALARLKSALRAGSAPGKSRASQKTVMALLTDGILRF